MAAAATELLETEAVPRLVDAGRMGQAAKLYNEIADLLEAEGLTEQAIANFEKAADMFSAENTATAAQKCMIKVGHLCASKEAPEFARAADIFARVATESMSNPLLKFQARGLLFEAFLCTLAQADVVAADAALARFKDIDYTFPGSRECKLCEDILQAFKDMNGDAFTDAVFNYDQISKLDPWKTKCVGWPWLCVVPCVCRWEKSAVPTRAAWRRAEAPKSPCSASVHCPCFASPFPFLPPPHLQRAAAHQDGHQRRWHGRRWWRCHGRCRVWRCHGRGRRRRRWS